MTLGQAEINVYKMYRVHQIITAVASECTAALVALEPPYPNPPSCKCKAKPKLLGIMI